MLHKVPAAALALPRKGFETGTDPLDASSFFFLRAERSGGSLVIRWPSAPGATYRIEASDSLAADDWDEVVETHPADAGSETTYHFGDSTESRMFYRVGLN